MIYLATPYSHPSPDVMESRFVEACKAAGHLMIDGEIVFCPIAHTHPIAVQCSLPRGWDYWEKFDRTFIEAAKKVVVVMMPGWVESKGVQAEIKIAEELGKPVEFISPWPW